jgi:hypothetical protein
LYISRNAAKQLRIAIIANIAKECQGLKIGGVSRLSIVNFGNYGNIGNSSGLSNL